MSSTKITPIGGFMELHIENGYEFYSKLLKLNLGRNCLSYILIGRKYKKIYLPYYTCQSVIETIKNLNIKLEFYPLKNNLEPKFDFTKMKSKEAFLFTNYFGIMDSTLCDITKFNIPIIVDNAQAFFSIPVDGLDTFYSPRKFFGVPDGGYLATDISFAPKLARDQSGSRMKHLIKRKELGPELAFEDFKENEQELDCLEMMFMSRHTEELLNQINYDRVARIRNSNFNKLHKALHLKNQLNLNTDEKKAPLSYPFMCNDLGLRKKLIDNKIFIPQYWPNVLDSNIVESNAYRFAQDIMPLPIDQRYGEQEMERIVDIILS